MPGDDQGKECRELRNCSNIVLGFRSVGQRETVEHRPCRDCDELFAVHCVTHGRSRRWSRRFGSAITRLLYGRLGRSGCPRASRRTRLHHAVASTPAGERSAADRVRPLHIAGLGIERFDRGDGGLAQSTRTAARVLPSQPDIRTACGCSAGRNRPSSDTASPCPDCTMAHGNWSPRPPMDTRECCPRAASRSSVRSSAGRSRRSPCSRSGARTPCPEEASVGPIEHVEHSVAVGVQQQFARLALEHAVHQDHVFGGIPVVGIVGRELVMPLAAARIRIERDHRTRKQVVALAHVRVACRGRDCRRSSTAYRNRHRSCR